MREIKFRVWNSRNKNWDTPALLEVFNADGILVHLYDSKSEHTIIQQYTGLKDKNGKEIYEGDICDAGMVIGPVEFIIGSFSLASNPLIEFLPKNICVFDPDFDPSWIDVTVIGNIYENPELLKP
jgi:hypothetical protein